MKLFNELKLKFDHPDWSRNPEFGLIDTILEQNPDIILMMKDDIVQGEKPANFGRGDSPSVEQVVRAAIYKEMKGLDYRELEYAQSDSRICANFIKLDMRKPYSFQMFQKYISRIKPATLQKVLLAINKISINEGYEDLSRIGTDATVIETNVHYPTNNSLLWDCIKESTRLLRQLKEEMESIEYLDYTKSAKKTYFKINNTKSPEKREELFKKQLVVFTKTINNVSSAVKKKPENLTAKALQVKLEDLVGVMERVYYMVYAKEVLGAPLTDSEKLYSIYELHTDIIVKGGRDVQFGHKVNITTGKSNLILDCEVLQGNPSDKDLYQPTIERITSNYNAVPRDVATDGGYASKANLEYAKGKGIANVVFNKVVGSMQNIVSSLSMEKRLKKWRSTLESTVSNLKRGFDISRCNWKGWEHFQAKVLWSVLGYNFRVLTAMTLARIRQ
jgi:IS5 family transposase